MSTENVLGGGRKAGKGKRNCIMMSRNGGGNARCVRSCFLFQAGRTVVDVVDIYI